MMQGFSQYNQNGSYVSTQDPSNINELEEAVITHCLNAAEKIKTNFHLTLMILTYRLQEG